MNAHLIFDVVEDNLYTDKEGLALPIDKFNAVSMKNNESSKIWAFADKDVVMAIAIFNRYSFPGTLNTENILLKNGVESFVSKDQYQNSYLYYFDTDKVVVVSGNVSKEELIDLANTIPSVSAANFPSKQ